MCILGALSEELWSLSESSLPFGGEAYWFWPEETPIGTNKQEKPKYPECCWLDYVDYVSFTAYTFHRF